MVHASCRKPNGPGYDALAWLDARIEDTLTDTDARPQQLFLTGDQIYADDVADCLLPMLSGLAADVIGAVERVPIGPGPTDLLDVTMAAFPAMFRQRPLRELAGFTSTDAASHLVSFGEFAAMYPAVWSPRVWRALADSTDVVKSPSAAPASIRPHLTQWEACAAEEGITLAEKRTKHFDDERVRVEVFRDAVPRVARALANVSTYMICDDHEVTDDWNLNKRWRNRVFTKPMGRAVVRNGVTAYGVFQAWGNDPKLFAAPDTSPAKPNHNRHLLEETVKMFEGGGPYPAPGASLGRLDELTGGTDVADRQPTLHYKVPGPRHLVAVLDSRTRRGYDDQGTLSPSLLGASLNDMVPENLTGQDLLVVVSPAPVLGPHLIDTIAQPLLQTIQDIKAGGKNLFSDPIGPCEPEGRPLGAEHYDAEGWLANEVAFETLLKRLAPHGKTVILSGDVHYGCSLVLDYWRKAAAGAQDPPPPSRIVQLTSSPSRNSFRDVVAAILRSAALLQNYQVEPRPERLAWTSGPAAITVPDGASFGPGRRARMRRTPALLPARTWPAGTLVDPDPAKQPDWRWRLSLQRDQRPDSVRPMALRAPTLSSELDPANPVAGYREAANRHAVTAFTQFDHLRQMVFTNNIGLVHLAAGSDGALHVVHTLLSKDAPESTTSSENTVHDISLAPTIEAAPSMVTKS